MIWILTFMMIMACLLFLYLTHPLWISTLVFLLSIITAIHKFYSVHNNSMFGYLFVMIYSGGLLIMLTYISSLTPSTTTNKLPIKIMIMIPITYLFTWTMTKHNLNENYNYNELNLINMTIYLMSSPLINAVLTLLTTSFCLISSLLSQFKYPIRSL
nr:NADH dehydrogenase subunit 6 [Trichinella spiralis]QRN72437.1 NADH dehydrogenase subunit 6 [Trichinella spiralis]QRN72450.1 NADH dehydrogenase subunit 6 [Trichinella spiralis]QRN72463.1 NADH dehydrogenase subunit 6 [Trichinella spiralis]QRN72476.1 NADH dehydrogenase subunit 6 [Trichinella spiralis]